MFLSAWDCQGTKQGLCLHGKEQDITIQEQQNMMC